MIQSLTHHPRHAELSSASLVSIHHEKILKQVQGDELWCTDDKVEFSDMVLGDGFHNRKYEHRMKCV